MKILLIHNYYRYRGGEDTYFESLVELLKNKGHKVYIFIKNNKDISESFIDKLNIAKNLIFNNQKISKELSTIIKKYKPDIVHCNNIFPLITPTVYEVCKSFGLPIVQTIHNYRLLCPKGTLFRNGSICELCVNKRFKYPSIIHSCYQNSRLASATINASILSHEQSFRLVDYFIFPSNFTHNYYLKHSDKTSDKKNVVIPYFVRSETKSNIKSNYFLFIGRFSEEKGIIELINIFTTLPNIKIKIVGDGPLKKKVDIYKRYKNIDILGAVSHSKIYSLLAKAKCLIVSSRWFEVLPYVYLEALSMGTPTLTPNTSVFRRTVETNDLYYYTFGDLKNLRSKIIEINKHPNIDQKYKFKDEYLAHYTAECHYKKILGVYGDCTGGIC